MPTQIALLRGVNVGGKNKVPMAELRSLFEELGNTDVRTYIQSGNVLFSSPKAVTTTSVEAAIQRRFGISITVVLRSPAQLAKALRDNPFPKGGEALVHIGFMATKPSTAATKLDVARFEPERFAVKGSELYLYLPNGMGRAKLPPYVDRQLKIPTTVRNWNTVTTLLELAGR